MKQVTNMSRLVNQLEKMFRALNEDFFDGALEMPVITVTPSNRSYAHYTPWDAWETAGEGKREINIASGTLDRPIEAICGSLVHEMVHMANDTVLHVKDTSRNGMYHSKAFKDTAEAHGLIVERTEKYGWSRTSPSDKLLEWVLEHDEFREIELCRINPESTTAVVGIGANAAEGGAKDTSQRKPRGTTYYYHCPRCGVTVRASTPVNIICADCMAPMIPGKG